MGSEGAGTLICVAEGIGSRMLYLRHVAVMITKANGNRVPFSEDKIRQSIARAGGTADDIAAVLRFVVPKIKEGMTTRAIYALVEDALKGKNRCVACRYTLRDALMRLGPAGFHFEKYIAAILSAQGYEAELPEELQGACVRHEIDVVAHQGKKAFAIECKFRNDFGDHVRLKDVLASYARHLDLLDGAALQLCPHFNEFWIVTNGLFSDRSMRYAQCKGLRLMGWKYPDGKGLASMIDGTKLYPITVLAGLTNGELNAFANAGVILCQDLTNHESADLVRRTGLAHSRIEELVDLAAEVLEYKEKIVA